MFDLNYSGGGESGEETKATIKSIKVRKGAWIAKGQVVILVKDAGDKVQKIKTEAPGKVEQIHVSIGEQVQKG